MTEITLSPKSRPLGKSGLSVSPMAWGMWRFAGSDVRAARGRVEAALDAGMTLLDTADIYGPDNDEPFGASELLLGKVLAEAPALRDRMVLASKGGIRMGVPYDSSPAYLVEAVDASLTRLGVERIDLWQIHRPDMLAHPADTARTLEGLVKAGKIGAIGIRVSRQVAMHGFAFNANPSLAWADVIIPCGIPDAGVTSLSAEVGRDVPVREVLPHIEKHLTDVLGTLGPNRRATTEPADSLG